MGRRTRYEHHDRFEKNDDIQDYGKHHKFDWREADEDDDKAEDGDDHSFGFDLPNNFLINLQNLNLKTLGKITDYTITSTHLDVTFGNTWEFSVDGEGLYVGFKNGTKTIAVNGGTVHALTIDGPGKYDLSISGLDVSAKDLYGALTSFDVKTVLSLLLSSNETISGTGFGDYINGRGGNDTIFGNKGADCLKGGAGDDKIVGGRGNDWLAGGTGIDTFIFAKGSGRDVVADFDASADILDLTAYRYSGDIEDLLKRSDKWNDDHHGGDDRRGFGHGDDDATILDLGKGARIKLIGVDADQLTDANVLL